MAENTAVRHFNAMHHMMEKASTIWSKETGIDRNPSDHVEVRRPDDSRERYLSDEELRRLMEALDEKMYRKGTRDLNKTNLRLRLVVLIAVSTGMRSSEIFRLKWSDVMYGEGLLAVRARLKRGKIRYVPMPAELAAEIRRYPAVIGEDRILPPERGAKSGRQRLEGSFEDLLTRAKILGHSNTKMTERYAKLGREHITRTSSTAKVIWTMMKKKPEQVQEEGDQEDVA